MLLTLAFLAAQSNPSSEPTVEPARAVVARLGNRMGRTVTIEPSLGRIPVLVDAPELEPNATLRTLATALRASIVSDSKTLRIERTAEDRRVVSVTHIAAYHANIITGLANWDRMLRRADGLGDMAAQSRAAKIEVENMRRQLGEAFEANRPLVPPPDLLDEHLLNPSGRLLHRILTRLGADRLSKLASGERKFLSNQANASETSLPDCTDLLTRYEMEKSAFEKTIGTFSDGNPAKIILSVEGLGNVLDIYDARGHRFDGNWKHHLNGPLLAGPSAPPSSLMHRWVSRDVDSRQTTVLRAEKPETLKVEDLPKTYLYPERYDPLSFDVRTGIQNLPREPGAPALVAVLSDNLLRTAGDSVRGDKMDAAAFSWRILGESGLYERITRNGATVIRPKDALAAESLLVNRQALGVELRRIVSERDIGVRSRCLLQAAVFTGHGQPATEQYLEPLARMGFRGPWHSNHAYGALAIGGLALRANPKGVEVTEPHYEWLVKNGIRNGWLRAEKTPGKSDLDVAPSSLLDKLAKARLYFPTTETPVVMRYGNVGEAEMRKLDFRGEVPEKALEFPMAGIAQQFARMPERLRTEERKRQTIENVLGNVRYLVGHRNTLAVELRLLNGLRARVEYPEDIADQVNLTLDQLPPKMREAILKYARNVMDNPPPLTPPLDLPTLPIGKP